MYEWVSDLLNPKLEAEPGNALVRWYAIDIIDGEKLSPKSMQEGLKPEEAAALWQKKHWMLVKEKLIAREMMTYADARIIKSWEDLKAWIENKKSEKKDSVVTVQAEKPATIQMSAEQSQTVDNVNAALNIPIDVSKANIADGASKRGSIPKGSGRSMGEKIAKAVEASI